MPSWYRRIAYRTVNGTETDTQPVGTFNTSRMIKFEMAALRFGLAVKTVVETASNGNKSIEINREQFRVRAKITRPVLVQKKIKQLYKQKVLINF